MKNLLIILLFSSCTHLTYEQIAFKEKQRNLNREIKFKGDKIYIYQHKYRIQTIPSLTH